MGQGGSISENKSIILSNWMQMKQKSNIFFNKVTNQQVQRHEVLINSKDQLTSYVERMRDQSALICRLIYFHPKSLPKEQENKQFSTKFNPHELQHNVRAESKTGDGGMGYDDHKIISKNETDCKEQEGLARIYCVYTDRMLPIKQWKKDKIINVIQAFKLLQKTYGFFKVRELCICENQRKQVKVWINQNPVSNFPIETVQSQEDMIVDLAALLVSRKQKIAKQLLDLQYFNQAIKHLGKVQQYDNKKYTLTASNNTGSHRQNNSTAQHQIQHTAASFPASQINNFYNVFINSDNNYTVGGGLKNSKYKLVDKGTFGYSHNSQKNNPLSLSQKQENGKNQTSIVTTKYNTQNDISMKKQNNPTSQQIFNQIGNTLGPVFNLVNKIQENTLSFKTTQSNICPNTLDSGIKQIYKNITHTLNSQGHDDDFQQRQLLENTSIICLGNKGYIEPKYKTSLYNTQKGQQNVYMTKQKPIISMATSQKKTQSKKLRQSPTSQYLAYNKKGYVQKIVTSQNQQLHTRSKNNSSGDIQILMKSHIKTQHSFMNNDYLNFQKRQNNVDYNTISNKQFFSNEDKGVLIQNYLSPQAITNFGRNILAIGKQKVTQLKRNTHLQEYRHVSSAAKSQLKVQNDNRGFCKYQGNPTARSKSKIDYKYSSRNQLNVPSFYSHRNVVSQMSTLKTTSNFNYNSANEEGLQKKSFPKYFQQKQSTKSIQKYYQKSLQQRQKSKALLNNVQLKPSQFKVANAFLGENVQYQTIKAKDVTQQIVFEVHQSQTCSQEIIQPPPGKDNLVRYQSEAYEQRRKFPSTSQYTSKKNPDLMPFQKKQLRKKPGTQIDSQQSYVVSSQVTKQRFKQPFQASRQQTQLKKSNNTYFDSNDHKNTIMTSSYFSHINTNNSVLISHNTRKGFQTDIKKRKNFPCQNENQGAKFKPREHEKQQNSQNNGNDEISSKDYNQQSQRDRCRESMAQDQGPRTMSFPNKQHNIQRRNQKNLTFLNANQKPSVVGVIEQIKPYQHHQKSKLYVKKQSFISNDQQTLPRTTTDQKQKRIFKVTRTSQIIDTNDLYSSDPGFRIQQIIGKLQKSKQKLNSQTKQMFSQKIDCKLHPKFKKWEPSPNVYGSQINQQFDGSSVKKDKKQNVRQEKDRKMSSDRFAEHHDNEERVEYIEKITPSMPVSDNLQIKKKVRKQVFMDYKGLFGDEDPFQRQQTKQQKQKKRRLQTKKRRQQQQQLLQNTSSKDLLIQQKVKKQRQKHAQLKSDLSKLFTGQI